MQKNKAKENAINGNIADNMSENVAQNVDVAIEDIKYIREIMEGSKDFFISGWSGIAWGITTIAGVIFTYWAISNISPLGISRTLWVAWIILFTVASSVESYYFYKGARDTGRLILSAISAKILTAEIVMCLQALALTFLFIHHGIPEYIPGVWLITTGGMMIVAGLFFPGGIWAFGALTFVAAIVAFIMPELGLICVGFTGAASLFWGIAYLVVKRK